MLPFLTFFLGAVLAVWLLLKFPSLYESLSEITNSLDKS